MSSVHLISDKMTDKCEMLNLMIGPDQDVWVSTNTEKVIFDFKDGKRDSIYNSFVSLFKAMKKDTEEVPISENETLENGKIFRVHDDNEGDMNQGLVLQINEDDKEVSITAQVRSGSVRFRMPMIGGGKSINTFRSLRELFLEIDKAK